MSAAGPQLVRETDQQKAGRTFNFAFRINSMGSFLLAIVLFPVRIIVWIIALPIQFVAWLVLKLRDPKLKNVKCPACGYRDSRMEFTRTTGKEQAAVRHICLWCGNDQYFSKLIRPADEWLGKLPLVPQNLRDKVANTTL